MYRATTNDIQVTVLPRFLADQSRPEESRFFWAYQVEISNLGSTPVQLVSRHWKITDAHGRLHEVRGPGVIGEQPVIAPGESFTYTSGCPLETSQGFMAGSYDMKASDGRMFKAEIPAFSLDSPEQGRILN